MTNTDGQFTLDNLTQIGRYSSVFARSLILAAISTVVCLVIAFPVGYFLSRLRANKSSFQQCAIYFSSGASTVNDLGISSYVSCK